ncbi:MAG: helix-turn-helix transcriptional regulator [Ilumatobacteraceae bacterium]
MTPARRADLAEFLRVRRQSVTPEDVGLPRGERRRTAGLRGKRSPCWPVSRVSWYTWLEQGRPINASLEVIEALGRALRLDAVEREHLLLLAGHPHRRPVAPGTDRASDGVIALLVGPRAESGVRARSPLGRPGLEPAPGSPLPDLRDPWHPRTATWSG